MRTGKWVGVGLAFASAVILQTATVANADVTSDRAAAILLYPKVITDATNGVDTVIQVSNTSNDPVILWCFYVDANSHCSGNERVCDPISNPCAPAEGLCIPGWIETDFRVILTPQQPLAWLASSGLANGDLPLDGIFRQGIRGSTNAGTRVPPVAEDPFLGELKCVVVDEDEHAVARNVVKGEATIVASAGDLDVEKYNALGILAIEGDANGDKDLVLGGDSNEYNGCPNVLIVDHFFDFATNPVSGGTIFTDLTLVPCQQDLLNQIPGGSVAQYLVFNEYEQRFSTSTPIQCFFERQLSSIDTRNPVRSIFSVFVAGTLTGQTRIRGVGSGLVGVVREFSGDRSSAFNLHMQGIRPQADHIVLP